MVVSYPEAAPGRQGSQVISRLLWSSGRSSGDQVQTPAQLEPGYIEVRKPSYQVTRCTFVLKKSWRPILVVALKTQATKNTVISLFAMLHMGLGLYFSV